MSYDFNADDVFEIAEQLERNGVNFYRKAAEGASDSAAKKLLVKLADMEYEHEKDFKSLRAGLGEKEKASLIFDPQDEAVLYLRALADTRVFFEKKIDNTSLKEIYKSAIEAEKDSIVFYLGMKDAVPAKFGKDKIEAIIKEEMQHIRMLSSELTGLK
ncbi:MAG: ferritin family protein [Proteobacteria bacterium]|nr:ferritin family protein [Pseudomonadota bacterium]MBU4011079.1 ferritin family protein [Pseudomonadota bacterium]